MSTDFLENVYVNIIAEVIFAGIIWFLSWLRSRFILVLSRMDPRLPAAFYIFIVIVWVVINISSFYIVYIYQLSMLYLGGVLVSTTIPFLYFVFREINQFWIVGLRGADKTVRSGIDYRKSLSLVQNQLSFLGTGAAKLTKDEEFDKALLRCRIDIPIRLLLLRPDDDNLTFAAKRAGKSKDEYCQIVLSSLRKIKDLKERRNINIEVRFYPSNPRFTPVFRLLFIDDSICLLSYNIFGEGDGSQLPQLHFAKAADRERVSTSFYYPLEIYYKWLWDLSEPWDFTSYLINA